MKIPSIITAVTGLALIGSMALVPGNLTAQEPHPRIHQAICQLEAAKQTLQQHTAHDFHGHRVAAIGKIDEAINQLHIGLQQAGR